MTQRALISALVFILLLTACSQSDQAALQTVTAKAAQTAAAEGQRYFETEVARAQKTAIARLATEVASKSNSFKKIGLDPGHGWQSDPGAIYNGLKEKDVNLDIALRTKGILEGYGFQVMMTRTADDTKHGLDYAHVVVNEQNPTIVISIHANGDASGTGTGTEGCYTVGKSTDADSKKLAQLLTNSVAKKMSIVNRGIFPENSETRCARSASTHWSQLYIHDMNPPAALIETAFLSNRKDADLLKNQPQMFAQAITEGILAFFENSAK